MDERNQTKRTSLMWVFVDLIFLFIIGVLMVNYIRAGKANGKSAAFDRVNAALAANAECFKTVAKEEVALSKAIRDYATKENLNLGDEATRAYAQSIVDNTEIEHFMFCEGNDIICDESGKNCEGFDLKFCAKTSENEFYLLNNTPYGSDMQLVAYVSCSNGKYILAFISCESVARLFKTEGYEDASFLAIVDSLGGTIVAFSRYKDKDCEYLSAERVLDNISEHALINSENNLFRSNIRNGLASAVNVRIGDDSRTVSAINLGVSNWYLVFGVRSVYMDKIIEYITSPVRSAIYKLFTVIAAFSIFVAATVIMSSAKNKEKGRVLENKADTDLLTDLYNKVATERKIQDYIEENPNGRGLIFVLDIDNFKKINDTMGHAFGDTLLKTLGKEIKSEFRVTDIIGRTGGDEFMVFLKDVTDDVIVEREASRITKFFQDFKAGGDYVKYSATASIGAAIFPDDAKSFKDLYVAADQALYRAKKRGKNQLVFYNETEKRS